MKQIIIADIGGTKFAIPTLEKAQALFEIMAGAEQVKEVWEDNYKTRHFYRKGSATSRVELQIVAGEVEDEVDGGN